jgi:hypothetical protein
VTTKTYQLRKAWHVLKAEGFLPQSVPDGHEGPLLAFKSIDDELPAAFVAFNAEDNCFGVLAPSPLQGRLLHLLNAMRTRKLDSVVREPITPAAAAGVDEFVRSEERKNPLYQSGRRDAHADAGAKGGKAKSQAKAAAARENIRKRWSNRGEPS